MNIESIQASTITPRGPSPDTSARVVPATPHPQAATNDTSIQSNPKQSDLATLHHAVQHLSDFVSSFRPEINFTVDQASGVQVVKIVDNQSKQVIRQIPSEEAIQIAQALDKLQGLFVKETA